MARYDDLNTKMIGLATFLSSILLVVIIVGVQALSYYWETSEYERKSAGSEYTQATQVLESQRQVLAGYGAFELPADPADPNSKMVKKFKIPIERAMELTVEKWKEKVAAQPGT
jgi:hypothetical protein